MVYYVLESAVADGARAKAVHVKETYDGARMLFHQVRASALADANVSYSLAMVIGENGEVFDREWHGHLAGEQPDEPVADDTLSMAGGGVQDIRTAEQEE